MRVAPQSPPSPLKASKRRRANFCARCGDFVDHLLDHVQDRQRIAAFVSRVYAETFARFDLMALDAVINTFSTQEQARVGRALRVRPETGRARGRAQRFRDVILDVAPAAPAGEDDTVDDDVDAVPTLRRAIQERLASRRWLEATLVFEQDEREAAEEEEEANKSAHERQPPEQQNQYKEQFNTLLELWLKGSIEAETVQEFAKKRMDLDLPKLKRPPPSLDDSDRPTKKHKR